MELATAKPVKHANYFAHAKKTTPEVTSYLTLYYSMIAAQRSLRKKRIIEERVLQVQTMAQYQAVLALFVLKN